MPESLLLRALLGALIAAVVAVSAHRAGSLTRGGLWAAIVVGTLATAAGGRWAALLIGYFVLSSLATGFGHARKAARVASVVPTERARGATQVAANGAFFALAMCLGSAGDARWLIAGLGALAASAADTWATEFGTLWGGEPRSVVTWARVPTGASGGVTWVGFAATLAAAALVGVASAPLLGKDAVLAHTAAITAITAGGVAGSLGDSLLGATLQAKRWCARCRTYTERERHDCGERTQHARGLRGMTNDTVNFAATLIGAATAVILDGALRTLAASAIPG